MPLRLALFDAVTRDMSYITSKITPGKGSSPTSPDGSNSPRLEAESDASADFDAATKCKQFVNICSNKASATAEQYNAYSDHERQSQSVRVEDDHRLLGPA
ncbi:hypothetical protein CAC42_2935 [Sphaceloma murrayae]|uniref:Uncharacterized protein n=1 Tax=Sphaceloma murrayae TaxID=2082308 RepID=A0A2K1R0E0_9PEZI|nr:hypothetical protein CAC42_2935 [Sphaceloma murrayae]